MTTIQDEELISVALLINDDLQKTFSRYADLKKKTMPEVYISAFLNSYTEGFTSNNTSNNPSSYSKPPSDPYSPPVNYSAPSAGSSASSRAPPRPSHVRPTSVDNYKPPPSTVKQSDPNDTFGLFDAPEEVTAVPSMPIDPTPVLQPITAPLRPTPSNNFSYPSLEPRCSLLYHG